MISVPQLGEAPLNSTCTIRSRSWEEMWLLGRYGIRDGRGVVARKQL